MKKQSKIEDAALDFAVQIYNLIKTLPDDERCLLGEDLIRDAVKIGAGISTYLNLNELKASFRFLNNAFSATFRVEVCLDILFDLHLVDSIDETMSSLEKIRDHIDKMLNTIPDLDFLSQQ